MTLGFVDLVRDDFIENNHARGKIFTGDWVSMRGVILTGSQVVFMFRHMPAQL